MKEVFKHHDMSEDNERKSDILRMRASYLYELLDGFPPCRETSLAMTKLEECVMWANKGLAWHDEYN